MEPADFHTTTQRAMERQSKPTMPVDAPLPGFDLSSLPVGGTLTIRIVNGNKNVSDFDCARVAEAVTKQRGPHTFHFDFESKKACVLTAKPIPEEKSPE